MTITPGSSFDAGDIYREFKAMRIKHPQHTDAVKVFERLRRRKEAAPDAEQTTACLFANSHAGKSTTVQWYMETTIVDECLKRGIFKKDGPRPLLARLQPLALYVKLRSFTTIIKLLSKFLESLNDPNPHNFKSSSQALFRINKALKGKEIIFIDETQHINAEFFAGPMSNRGDAREVEDTFKDFLTNTWPIVFVGKRSAEKIVFGDQVDTRSDTPIDFGPLHFGDEKHREIYSAFLARLCLKLVQHGLLPERPEVLLEGDVPLCLNISSAGRLGSTTDNVRTAIEIMNERGKRMLSRQHLEQAVNNHGLRIGLCKYNPFTEKPHTLPSLKEYMDGGL